MRQFIYSIAIAIVIAAGSCKSNRPATRNDDARISAAGRFTKRYAQSALAAWNIRGRAAGSDCSVLLVETSIILEDSMIEAMHYGAGAYEPIYPGGVQQFSRSKSFRGVAYKDVSGRIWTYGDIPRNEALTPCH